MSNTYKNLTKDSGFNEEKYNEIVSRNKGLEALANSEYRFELLKNRNGSDMNFSEDKENIEKLFIESFSDSEFKRLLKKLKINNWTIEQAYKKAKQTGRKLSYILNNRNI